jgi:hypothetical protein
MNGPYELTTQKIDGVVTQTSPKAAFEKECKNYHDFGGSEKLDNKQHPERPDGTNWECPVCDMYD